MTETTPKVAIKFLLTNSLAGSLIGTGGNAIKELIEISAAKVNVSGNNEQYPGTNDRVVLISGPESTVKSAQTLVWLMIAQNTKVEEEKSHNKISWSPRDATQDSSDLSDILVEGRITIPAAAGGAVLGKGGLTIKAIGDESGARVQMTSREESMFTQERVLTISGSALSCAKCVASVVAKLGEDPETNQFVNRGTTYSSQLNHIFGGANGPDRGGRGGRGSGGPRGGRGGPGRGNQVDSAGADVCSSTEIKLTIPDNLIGNILGKKGATMREIMSLSQAKVVVSPREEVAEGSTDRQVTITGSPYNAQTAHHFILQKLKQATVRKVHDGDA